jgi:hypothetical protein
LYVFEAGAVIIGNGKMKEKYSPEMARKKFHLMGQILPIASSWLVVEKNLMGTTKIR